MSVVLSQGSSGEAVVELQELLRKAGYGTSADGQFGPATRRSVIEFQRNMGLFVDGVAGKKTIDLLRKEKPDPKVLHEGAFVKTGNDLGVHPAILKSLYQIESRGSGFEPDGQVKILYERHVMVRQLQSRGLNFERWYDRVPNILHTRAGGYIGGPQEHTRRQLAAVFDVESSYEACSWGVCQVMGMHWQNLGYPSVKAFVEAQNRSEDDQFDTVVRFIRADRRLLQAMKDLNFETIARIYNGPGFRTMHSVPYDDRLRAGFQQFQDIV